MKNKITKASIDFLSKHWKKGAFQGYQARSEITSNLKKLGIIDQKSERGMYFINREVYDKLIDCEGDQTKLPGDQHEEMPCLQS